MGESAYIYALCDPRAKTHREGLRYVGKTCASVEHRMRQHIRDCKRKIHRHCANWINSLLREGVSPTVLVLNKVPKEWAGECEDNAIKGLRRAGINLTNSQNGGVGRPGNSPSADTRSKISRANKGRNLSEETKFKMSIAKSGEKNPFYGKTHSVHHCNKLRIIHTGKSFISKSGKEILRDTTSKRWKENPESFHPSKLEA